MLHHRDFFTKQWNECNHGESKCQSRKEKPVKNTFLIMPNDKQINHFLLRNEIV